MNVESGGNTRWLLIGLMICWILAGTASAAERMAVKASIANLRNGPGKQHKVLWQVEKYHPFLVVSKKKNWYEIKDFEGDTAWIHNSLLAKINAVITVKDKCNVRAEPSTKAKKVLRVEKGVPFKVIKRKGDWLRIEHADGEVGWIWKSLVW